MSENNPVDPHKADSNPPRDDGDVDPSTLKENEPVPWAVFDKVSRSNNWARTEHTRLKKEIGTLNQKVADLEGSVGKSKSDFTNDIANRDKKISELQEQNEKYGAQIRDLTVKSEVLKNAAGKIRDDAYDTFWKLEGENFGEVEFKGEKKVGMKSEPYLGWTEIFEAVGKRHPYLMSNTRAKGGDVPQKGEKPEGESFVLPKDFDSWSFDKKTQYFKELPEDHRKSVRSQLGLK